MTKRKTAQQREDEARDRLHERVADIVSGACGRDMISEAFVVDITEAGRVVLALQDRLMPKDAEGRLMKPWMVEHHNLHCYASVAEITDFFYRSGVRA